MAANDPNTQGSISEWNEGNLKNLRMDEAQRMINYGKRYLFDYIIDPFSKMFGEMKWGYDIYIQGIINLLAEGVSKYSETEEKQSEDIRKITEKIIKVFPPFKKSFSQSYSSDHDCYLPIEENQDKIKEALYKFEYHIKKLNDAHGLSTRNKEIDEEESWD